MWYQVIQDVVLYRIWRYKPVISVQMYRFADSVSCFENKTPEADVRTSSVPFQRP